MTEKEIRAVIQAVCADLDQRVRQVVTKSVRKVVLPAALGAGLALSTGACNDDDRSVPTGDAQGQVDGQAVDAGPLPPYMAADAAVYAAPFPDGGPVPPYMAPDIGPQPDYMAPEPDGGAVALYSAPPADLGLDSGAQMDYMAPDPDAAPLPPYMAPDPDAST